MVAEGDEEVVVVEVVVEEEEEEEEEECVRDGWGDLGSVPLVTHGTLLQKFSSV